MRDANRHARNLRPPSLSIAAGVAAPVLFAAIVIVQGLLYDDYSHRSMMVSALSAWPNGYIQNANFFVTGFLFALFGAGLFAAYKGDIAGRVSGALFAVAGAGLIAAGAFPMRMEHGVLIEPASHVIPSVIAFVSAGFALIATAMSPTARRSMGAPAYLIGVLGVATLVGIAVMARLAIPPEGLLHADLGFVQRTVIVCWMGGIFLTAFAMRRH